jgi:hypothetical protein
VAASRKCRCLCEADFVVLAKPGVVRRQLQIRPAHRASEHRGDPCPP